MVDESFHLTPLDARRYDFGSALRGYDKARVDQFRDQVADELERLTRVGQDLESKAKGFHEQLRAFRERDKALNEALVSAQQLRGEIREQADREAQLVLREARAQAEQMLEEARGDIRRLQAEVDALERTRRSYLAQLRALAQRQLTDIEAAETTGAAYAASFGVPSTPAPAAPRNSSPAASALAITPPPPPTSAGHVALDVPETRPVPILPADARTPRGEARVSERDTRTPTWLDSSVPE